MFKTKQDLVVYVIDHIRHIQKLLSADVEEYPYPEFFATFLENQRRMAGVKLGWLRLSLFGMEKEPLPFESTEEGASQTRRQNMTWWENHWCIRNHWCISKSKHDMILTMTDRIFDIEKLLAADYKEFNARYKKNGFKRCTKDRFREEQRQMVLAKLREFEYFLFGID